MDEQEQLYLKEHYRASEWLGRQWTEGTAQNVELTESDISGWMLNRTKRHHAAPPFSHSVWTNSGGDIITVRITECADAKAAQHQLLKELGTFHLPGIERRASAIGDVSFGKGKTMALFARANVVVTILNASPQKVSVAAVARDVDVFINQKIRESP